MSQSPELIDVFLCHARADKDWVRELAERLEDEDVEGRPLRVFFDELDIAPGENVLSRIEDGLTHARFVAVALSPALTDASWPTLEWQTQVYDDPTGKRGRIIPLIVEKFDSVSQRPLEIPLPLRLLRYLDFSNKGHFERQFRLLLARIRGDRPSRERSSALADRIAAVNPAAGPEAPALVDETVLGNLFRAELPEWIYSDISTTTSQSDIWKSLENHLRTPFLLHAHRLYAFVPYEDASSPFQRFLTGSDRRRERVSEILEDPQRRSLLLWLCNDALRQHCYGLRLKTPRGDRHRYYPVVSKGEAREFSWGKGAKLTLAKITSGDSPLGVHHAARMRFIEIAGRLHLLVQPCYFFTTDGINRVAKQKAGRYSVRWGGREGNRTVLRRTLMWPRILSRGAHEIALPAGGPEPIKIATIPRYGRSNQGILGDSMDVQGLLEAESAREVPSELDDLDEVAADYRQALKDENGDGPSGEVNPETAIQTAPGHGHQPELEF